MELSLERMSGPWTTPFLPLKAVAPPLRRRPGCSSPNNTDVSPCSYGSIHQAAFSFSLTAPPKMILLIDGCKRCLLQRRFRRIGYLFRKRCILLSMKLRRFGRIEQAVAAKAYSAPLKESPLKSIMGLLDARPALRPILTILKTLQATACRSYHDWLPSPLTT